MVTYVGQSPDDFGPTLPSGDAYFLLQGIDRELLVPRPIVAARSGPRASG
jgi:hypothetical protein